MLPSGSWLHITVGFIFGVISAVFAFTVYNQLLASNPRKKLLDTLVLYSFSIGLVAFLYASALSGGFLVKWKLLGVPEIGDPAIKILDIGYVQSKSGKLYHNNAGAWEQVNEVTVDEEEIFIPSSNCGTLSFLPLLKTDFVESKSACVAWGPDIEKVVYAINKQGGVYMWSHRTGDFRGIELVYFPIGGAILSGFFGVFIISVIALLNYLKSKRNNSDARMGGKESMLKITTAPNKACTGRLGLCAFFGVVLSFGSFPSPSISLPSRR